MKNNFKIIQGDSLEILPTLPDNSIDSIVTDPPYELGFMDKGWDKSGIANNVQLWKECLRVLKPGGHLLAFSGSRTYHRMTCAIEDAGFEIRDQIMWVYGSGFPKSLNVSKAIDKAAGAEREVITAPATPLARQWDGWGTALKPAHEPICVARKPLAKGNTVADNVVEFGTGAINVDGCRVGTEQTITVRNGNSGEHGRYGKDMRVFERINPPGRWPANFIHDGSPEVTEGFPESKSQSGGKAGEIGYHGGGAGAPRGGHDDSGSAARFFYCAKASKADRDEGLDGAPVSQASFASGNGDGTQRNKEANSKNNHPTVKPTSLMAYLVRLVTPPGGTVLDPFTGSGSTGKACMREGFNFIGIELTPEYIQIAEARIKNELETKK